jgi:hypothetical protein
VVHHNDEPTQKENKKKKKSYIRTLRALGEGMMAKTFLVLVFFILLSHIYCGSRSINSQWAAEKLHINRFPCGLMDDIKGKLAAPQPKKK